MGLNQKLLPKKRDNLELINWSYNKLYMITFQLSKLGTERNGGDLCFMRLLEFYDERNKIEVKNNVQHSFLFQTFKNAYINRLTIDKSKLK